MNEKFTTNQFIKPLTLKRNKNLYLAGCDLADLAHKYGTPLYVIDEKTLREVCRDYSNAFSDYENISMMYASKALCNRTISKIIYEEGFGFDVVSAGEIYTLLNAGIDMKKVLFNGNNKTPDEIEFAIKSNIGRFSTDNFHEIELISAISEKYNKHIDVLLRITPGIDCHTHKYIRTGQFDSKFGFDMTQIDIAIEQILQHKNIQLRGLHAHIGSQIFESTCYEDEIEILTKEISRINKKFNIVLDEINIGGGLGVKYTENDNPPSIDIVAKTIINALNKNIEKYSINKPKLYLEPGRSIISTAGITLYTVGSSKKVEGMTKYVSIDGGMADNPRPSLYEAEYIAELVNDNDGRKYEKITIAGKYCESGDILINDIVMPELHPDDIICVYNTGAYNYSMANNYNSSIKPAMVLVNNSQSDIIIYRETYENLISRDCIPDRFV